MSRKDLDLRRLQIAMEQLNRCYQSFVDAKTDEEKAAHLRDLYIHGMGLWLPVMDALRHFVPKPV